MPTLYQQRKIHTRTTLLLFLVLLLQTATAQKARIDSLAALTKAPTTLSLADYAKNLSLLSAEYLYTNYDSSKAIANRVIDLATTHQLHQTAAQAYTNKAYVALYQSNFAIASSNFIAALRIAEKYNYKPEQIRALSGLGEVAEFNHEYHKAFVYFRKSYHIAKDANDTLLLGNCLFDLYSVSEKLSNKAEAAQYFELAQKAYQQLGDDESVAMLFLQKATLETYHQQYQQALATLHQHDSLLKITDFIGDPAEYGITKATAQLFTNQLVAARTTINKAIEWCRSLNEIQSLADAYVVQAQILKAEKQYTQARSVLWNATNIYQHLNTTFDILTTYQHLLSLDTLQGGNKDSLLYHFQLAKELSDSLLQQHIAQQDEEVSISLEAEKKELLNTQLKASQEKNMLRLKLLIALAFVSLITLLAIGILYNRNKTALKQIKALQNSTAAINAQLEKDNEVKNKLLSIMSHELRSPLTSLAGLLQLAKQDAVSQEEFRSFLHQLESESNNALFLIDNLLHWTRVQMKGLAITKEVLPLNKLCTESLTVYHTPIQQKQLKIITNISNQLKIVADANVTKLILRNIINNAIKYSPNGGTIHISAMQFQHDVAITITDQGMGIDSSTIDKIMAGLAVNSTRGTSHEKGSGIGLQFSLELLRNMGGKFNIQSSAETGTIFTIQLPAG